MKTRLVVLLLVLAACDKSGTTKDGVTPTPSAAPAPAASVAAEPIVITSTSFTASGPLPAVYSCDGRDIIPALAWTNPPAATGAQALVVDDPDAPSGTFTHLVAWNLSADARSIGEGSSPATVGGQLGKNDFGKVGWSGPCPPKGALHHYRFRVLALDKPLAGLKPGSSNRADLDAATKGHVIGEGVLVGTFKR